MIDELDRGILSTLRKNARTPFLKIAKKLHCSEGTIRKRVKKLEENGVIVKYSLQLNPKMEFEAVVGIKARPRETKRIIEKLKKMDEEVSPILEVTGKFDIICNVKADNAKELNKLLDRIRAIDGVIETESFTIVERN